MYILDIEMPGMDGLAVASIIEEPHLGIVKREKSDIVNLRYRSSVRKWTINVKVGIIKKRW